MMRLLIVGLMGVGFSLLSGCGDSSKPKASDRPAAPSLPAELFLAASPGAAKSIEQVKKDAKEGDEVIVRVVVGGVAKPIVAGLASMVVVDASVPSCAANPDDTCETPWDYCCTAKEVLDKGMASVVVLDKDGKLLKASFAGGDKIKPHDTLVVKGRVGAGVSPTSIEINATAIFVEASLKKK